MASNKTNENLTNEHDFDAEAEVDEKTLEDVNGGAFIARPKNRKFRDSSSESDE